MSQGGWVYILASGFYGTLYVGVTSELEKRIATHKSGAIPGFTRKYDIKTLVRFEEFSRIEEAIAREKQLKRWNRNWKINLIESENPHWNDLAADWFRNSPKLGQTREIMPRPKK